MAQWLRCRATNRKVAGSIPDGVIGIFLWRNPSNHTKALGSTQPLTEMSTRRISWGKCGRCVRLTALPPPCAIVMKSGNLNFLEPSGPLQACNGTALHLPTFMWLLVIVDFFRNLVTARLYSWLTVCELLAACLPACLTDWPTYWLTNWRTEWLTDWQTDISRINTS